MQPKNKIISTTKSWIWNGNLRLEGELSLTPCCLFFKSKDFPDSHINFKIELEEIVSAKTFLLFNIEKNGLHIKTKDSKNEYFILENIKEFKEKLNIELKKI